MDPDNFYPVYNLALLLKQLRDNQCVEYLEKAFTLADKDALKVSVLLHLAIHYETNTDLIDTAIDYYEQALGMEPTNKQIELKLKQIKESKDAKIRQIEENKMPKNMEISGRMSGRNSNIHKSETPG